MALRIISLALAACVPLAAAAQNPVPTPEQCDSICALPELPPPGCDCHIILGGSGGTGGTDSGPPTAAGLLDSVQSAYEARVEGVDNYAVVIQPAAAPTPVVQYYEKEVVGGRPTFRQLSPAELAERQAQETGRPTPRETGDGLDALADALGGNLPAGAPPASRSVVGVLAEGIRGTARILRNAGPFETRQDLLDRLWNVEEFRERAEWIGTDTVRWSECGERTPCGAESAVYSEDMTANVLHADSLEDVDLGEGSEGYVLKEVTYWIVNNIPVKMRAVLARGERRIAMQQTIHQHYRAHRMLEPGFVENAIVEVVDGQTLDYLFRVARHRMLSIAFLIRLNEGPPTDEDIALMIAVALGRADHYPTPD